LDALPNEQEEIWFIFNSIRKLFVISIESSIQANQKYPSFVDHIFNLLDGSVLVIPGEVEQDSEGGHFSASTT